MKLRENSEPTPLCDACAQIVIVEIQEQNERMAKAIKDLMECNHGEHEIPTADAKALRAAMLSNVES